MTLVQVFLPTGAPCLLPTSDIASLAAAAGVAGLLIASVEGSVSTLVATQGVPRSTIPVFSVSNEAGEGKQETCHV